MKKTSILLLVISIITGVSTAVRVDYTAWKACLESSDNPDSCAFDWSKALPRYRDGLVFGLLAGLTGVATSESTDAP